jgi:hypothetical protein
MTGEMSTLGRVSALQTRQAARTGGQSSRQGVRSNTWSGIRPLEDAKQKQLGASGVAERTAIGAAADREVAASSC